METRTLIEQAKGIIIIAQQHCSPEHASELLSILSQQHRHGHLTASPPDMASHAAAAPASLPVSDAVVLWLSSPDWTRPSGPSGLRQTGASGQRRPAGPAGQASRSRRQGRSSLQSWVPG